MAIKYAVANGNWSSTSTWSNTDGGSPGAAVPANNDSAIICSGVTVTFDVDQSAFANGIAGLIIRGGVTPGMLRFKYDADGTYYLKIKDATTISGTTDTNRGRLLANGTGVWGDSTVLPLGRKVVIELIGPDANYKFIDAVDLDIALYCSEPSIPYATLYKNKYTISNIDINTSIITTNSNHGWSDYTRVALASSGSMPEPILQGENFYSKNCSGDTLKIKWLENNYPLTFDSSGTGTIEIYDGITSGTTTLNTLEDISSDPHWSTTTNCNSVLIVNRLYNYNYSWTPDIQGSTISSIGTNQITINNAIDSDQYPAARIYLLSRNISILYTSLNYCPGLINYGSATHGGIFQCEIRATLADYVSFSFPAAAIERGVGHVIGGCISGFNTAIEYASVNLISGVIAGCGYGIYASFSTLLTATAKFTGFRFQAIKSPTNLTISNADFFGVATCTDSYVNDGLIENTTFTASASCCNFFRGTVNNCTFIESNACIQGRSLNINNSVFHSCASLTCEFTWFNNSTIIGSYSGLCGGPVYGNCIIDQCINAFSNYLHATLDATVTRCTEVMEYVGCMDLSGEVFGEDYGLDYAGGGRIRLYGTKISSNSCGLIVGDYTDLVGYQVQIIAPVRVQQINDAYWPIDYPMGASLYDVVTADGTIKWGYVEFYNTAGYTKTSDYSLLTHGTPPVDLVGIHETWFQSNQSWNWAEWIIKGSKNQAIDVDIYYKMMSIESWDNPPIVEICGMNKVFRASGEQLIYTELNTSDTDWHTAKINYTPNQDSDLKFRFIGKGGNNTSSGTGGVYWWFNFNSPTISVLPATTLAFSSNADFIINKRVRILEQ